MCGACSQWYHYRKAIATVSVTGPTTPALLPQHVPHTHSAGDWAQCFRSAMQTLHHWATLPAFGCISYYSWWIKRWHNFKIKLQQCGYSSCRNSMQSWQGSLDIVRQLLQESNHESYWPQINHVSISETKTHSFPFPCPSWQMKWACLAHTCWRIIMVSLFWWRRPTVVLSSLSERFVLTLYVGCVCLHLHYVPHVHSAHKSRSFRTEVTDNDQPTRQLSPLMTNKFLDQNHLMCVSNITSHIPLFTTVHFNATF